MLKIAERIKLLRSNKGLSQKELADIIQVHQSSEQRFEYGTARPSLDTLLLLADYFDVSLDYLVGRSDNPQRQ